MRLLALVCDLLAALAINRRKLALSFLSSLHRAALKVGTLLDSEGFVMDITNHIRLGFQQNLSAVNRTFDFAVHDHAFRGNRSGDMGPTSDNQRSTAKFALNLTIDLHEPFRGNDPYNLQSFSNHRSRMS